MPCSECGLDRPITNKTHNLCANCASIRNTGKSLIERQADSYKKYRERSQEKIFHDKPEREGNGRNFSIIRQKEPKIFQYKRIAQVSSKQSSLNSQLSQVKKSIELEAIQNDEYYCQGCGKSHLGLDKSHILPIGQYKHLELVKDNIQLLCRDCHNTWEYGTIDEQIHLLCFADNLIFIYEHDQQKFNRFITKIEEQAVWYIKGFDDDKRTLVNEILDKVMAGL